MNPANIQHPTDPFAEWIIELRRTGRSSNTVRGYELVYERNIEPTLGAMPVTKATTKTLTDLHGAHQARGLAARSVYQVHACLSSMFAQACRWGWREMGSGRRARSEVPISDAPPWRRRLKF